MGRRPPPPISLRQYDETRDPQMTQIPEPSREPSRPESGKLLLMGLGLSLLPRPLLQALADHLCGLINHRHPALRSRLAQAEGRRFHFCLEDLGFDAVMHIHQNRLSLKLTEKGQITVADVQLKGQSQRLLELMQGESDGDALFFARDLAVSGDTEALVSLRNALESETIDLKALALDSLGHLGQPARAAFSRTEALITRKSTDIDRLWQALTRPLDQRLSRQARQIATLETRLAQLEKIRVKP